MRAEGAGRIYLIFAALLLAGYVVTETRGVVFASAVDPQPLPPEVRSSKNGYRTHTFWHVGYTGGK